MRIDKCDRCLRIVWVNRKTYRGADAGSYCADCWDLVPQDSGKSQRQAALPSSGPHHNDPGFDNVMRALEQDQ